MKVQVRKNVLTHLWEVQAQDQMNKWRKVAEYSTKELAEKSAQELANGKSGKLPVAKKKTAQNASKTAKKSKA